MNGTEIRYATYRNVPVNLIMAMIQLLHVLHN